MGIIENPFIGGYINTTHIRDFPMITRIIKFNFLKLLLFFCIISIAQTSSFCDLKEGITREFDGPELKTISFTRHAYTASEDCRFPPQFLDQTQKMMEREAVFRHKFNVADGANVAQLCVYRSPQRKS